MNDEYNDQDLENVLDIALQRKFKKEQREKDHTDDDLVGYMTKDVGLSEEEAKGILNDYETGNLSTEEKKSIRKNNLGFLEKVRDVAGYLIKKKKKFIAVGAVAASLTIGFPVIDNWQTASEYALEALIKYDKPVKITNIEERKEVISNLIKILNNDGFSTDGKSQVVIAEKFLEYIENEKYTIGESAKIIEMVERIDGSVSQEYLSQSSIDYLRFVKKNKISMIDSEYALIIAKTKLPEKDESSATLVKLAKNYFFPQ